MSDIGSYLFDLPREMEPAIEAIATATGRPMEEIVRVLLNHAVASNPLCRALTAPRMPDLRLARYTIDIELKCSAVEESVDDVQEKLAGYAIEAALQDSGDEIVNAALKTLPPSVLEQVTVTVREDPPSLL